MPPRLLLPMVLVVVFATAAVCGAEVKLPAIFGDHMVLQREAGVPVWGTAAAGEGVRLTLAPDTSAPAGLEPITVETVADDGGRWSVQLPELSKAGPYLLTIQGSQTAEPLVFRDVLAGEVWVCSGQSNMEWSVAASADAQREIVAAVYPQMRIFHVARATAAEPAVDVRGAWQVVSPETISQFSAVGYYFGREVHRQTNRPVGLIGSSWGGTPVMAWMPPAALEGAGFGQALAEARKRIPLLASGPRPQPLRDEGIAKTQWAKVGAAPAGWAKTTLPGPFVPGPLDFDGAVWFTRQVEVPQELAGKPVTLRLGPIDDADVTFVNGVEVGRTSVPGQPRAYRVPVELVRPGAMTVTVRAFDVFGPGGFGGAPHEMALVPEGGKPVPLAGEWHTAAERLVVRDADEVARAMAGAPEHTATMLYNGMIAPLTPYAVRGFIWYQGESDAWQAQHYARLLRGMIQAWRDGFAGSRSQPFLIVQLANFMKPSDDPAGSDDWARLREAQRQVAGDAGNGLAVAIDIGDAQDIHPRNKQEAGRRLALIALRDTYGKPVEASGPTISSARVENGRVVLSFDHAVGLAFRGVADKTFAIGDARGRFAWARPTIEGNRVILTADAIEAPALVRYAWQSNPPAPLYNAAGLPAVPFEMKLE